MKFVEKCTKNYDLNKIKEFSKHFNLDEKVIRLLFSRGYQSHEQLAAFLKPSINDFHNPFLLKDMKELVKKINFHIKNNSKIVILGDYDTDGISASAILYKLFKQLGNTPFVFLPNRVADGYGLSVSTIDKIINLYNPQFIITVDCGISAHLEVDYALSKGVDIAITDHHEVPEIVPNCLIVNPKMPNQDYPFKELCGAGVAFKVAQGMLGFQKAKQFLTVASFATVADIVPLINENRAIVYYGLKNQQKHTPYGVKMLLQKLKITNSLTATDVAFKLAPKINASGRMGDASISFNLFISENKKEIKQNIDLLLEMNDKRLLETGNIVEDALQMLENVDISKKGIIVIHNEHWESGVLGIICSKLAEIYNRPACVLTKIDGVYKGSVRSIPAINIYDALSNVKDLLIQYGGHAQAAGVTIDPKNLEEFTTKLNSYILSTYQGSDFLRVAYYDTDLSNVTINKRIMEDINKLEPFGLANEKPLFKIAFNNSNAKRLPRHPNHIKLNTNNLELIAFNFGEHIYNLQTNSQKEAIIELNLEKYNGRTKIKGMVKHLRVEELKTPIAQDIIHANYLKQLEFIDVASIKNKNAISVPNIHDKINSTTKDQPFGTLVIANTFKAYEAFAKSNMHIKNFDIYEIENNSAENTLLFSPTSIKNFNNYKNIFLLDPPMHVGYANKLNELANNVYFANELVDLSSFNKLNLSRDTFAKYHMAIINANSAKIDAYSNHEYFDKIKKLHGQFGLNYVQFTCVLLVLKELNIIKDHDTHVTINNGVKSELTASKIYNFLNQILKA